MESTRINMNPNPMDPAPQKALALAAFFTVVGIAQLHGLQNAFPTPFQEAITAFRTSPWALTTLVDATIGAIFATVYLGLQSAMLAAVLAPFLGSIVVLLYMAVALLYRRDITAVLLPRSGSVEVCTPSKHSRVAFWGFAGMLFGFLAICAWAWFNESLQQGYRVIRTVPWVELTFLNNLGGLVFIVTFVIVREGGVSFGVTAWLLAFLLFGNAATCVYVMLVARDAITYDVAFEEMLLSHRGTITYDLAY